jgi:polysaccharide biosynthesis/export protein
MLINCLDGVMKYTFRINFLIIFLSVVLSFGLFGADNPLIVKSPYFTSYGDSSEIIQQNMYPDPSYGAQLGLVAADVPISPSERLFSAISNTAYPVTPGDSLLLVYSDGKTPISLTLQVDGAYRVVIPSIGTVDGRGKTVTGFVKDIETLVQTYLPFSVPRVSLSGTGSFTVVVRGEVTSTREVPAWGLSRLSSVVANATPYASTRKVQVTRADGSVATYDLYKALREGVVNQNPFVSAGDTITLLPAERIVTLIGEVVRPGVYQLLSGETLVELISNYGGGLLPSANSREVLVQRFSMDKASPLVVNKVDTTTRSRFVLEHLDEVRVNRLPVGSSAVSIEGAVSATTVTQQPSSSLSSSGKLFYQFYPGETIFEMFTAISHRFSTVSDLAGVYLQRGNTLIPINVQAILSGKEEGQSNLVLAEGDRFVVPFNQLFVTVAGGVLKPGNYPYLPDKMASYYITMAGGFDPVKNRNGDFAVVGKNGEKLSKDGIIMPESVITAKMNTFNAMNGQNLTNTIAVVGLVASIVAIVSNILAISSQL